MLLASPPNPRRVRAALLVLPVLLAILRAGEASAEPVTHQFTGQLTTIPSGSDTQLDLTGVFTLGQAVTLEYTIERDTAPVPQDAYTTQYQDAITALSFSIDSWQGSGTPSYSSTTVTNNQPSPLRFPRTQAGAYDQYSSSLQGGITAPPLGTIQFQSLTWTFDDVQGTVFDSTVLPRVFPDLSAFEGKTVTFLFIDYGTFKSGYVMATLAGVSTPAQATTWGGIKALYRH